MAVYQQTCQRLRGNIRVRKACDYNTQEDWRLESLPKDTLSKCSVKRLNMSVQYLSFFVIN